MGQAYTAVCVNASLACMQRDCTHLGCDTDAVCDKCDADLAAEWGSCRVLHDMVQDAQAAVQRVPLPQGGNLCWGEGKGAPVEIPIGAMRAALPET